MTRKPLPKAITRPSAEVRAISGIDGAAPTPRPTLPHDPVEPEPALLVSSARIANDAVPALEPMMPQLAAKRRAVARKLVARHRTFAAIGGLVPLPLANVAGVAAIILRMVKQLSDLYGVPFERDRTRAIVLGLIGGATPTGLGVTTAATLAFAIPGPGFVGLAVSAVSAGALTRGIGLYFIDQFEASAAPPAV
jgi:uncharacterized protein (DUF697 family)